LPHRDLETSRLSRYAQHLTVVASLVVITASALGTHVGPDVGLVTAAQGNSDREALAPDGDVLLPPTEQELELPVQRSSLTSRSMSVDPTPLPTPVPVDPDATPLAAPSAAPVVAAPAARAVAALGFPVPGGSISQPFRPGHEGVDIAAAPGVPVVAAEAGVVVSAGWRNNGGGLVVEIQHAGGLNTVYNHLGSVAVVSGQGVARGTLIGGMGCSGVCYGPHIQFDVRVNGRLVNPLDLM
jgi:hypothetical protein